MEVLPALRVSQSPGDPFLSEMHEIVIDPSVVDPNDVSMLQDLILAAVNEVHRTAKQRAEEKMRGLTGGLPLPPGLI